MNKNYLITLKPIDKFFFGGDMTFTLDGKETSFTSYIIESNYFPQQTSLLGMLRFLILRNSSYFEDGHIKKNAYSDVCSLIGKQSFRKDETNDFGVIKSLSNCFIRKGNENLSFEPFVDFSDRYSMVNSCYYGNSAKIIPSGYDAKKGYRKTLSDGTVLDNVFVEDLRLGINREIVSGKVYDNSLYKQVNYRFADEQYRFAFYAKIDESVNLKDYSKQIVSIGADNSQFIIEIEEAEVPQEEKNNGLFITLQSPAFLHKEDVDISRFAVTELIHFNYLHTNVNTTKQYHRTSESGIDLLPNSFQLYDSGSVFYFKDAASKNQFIQKLNEFRNFVEIGYNRYK
ncbi:type III-B CRISPR module-associated Cmr3 family protein [Tannerella sp.]|uniref:type III-B CRISPR module-associated Cmr3 family protein n=1 Tax=Tannerella sp. TaxID=2382127 RepID=UPI0026DA9F35|nr:type III-B CRISPR module-associated Cmr3 family protein [Tannerella sp.]MDO4703660.1 type III-B CRISPR module-associated Cmr3 family protein [Tannerella sp.]